MKRVPRRQGQGLVRSKLRSNPIKIKIIFINNEVYDKVQESRFFLIFEKRNFAAIKFFP